MGGIDINLVWAAVIAFAVLAYVIADGFDLGVGILFLLVPGRGNRDQMMNSVSPVWDGNETWLVLGGGGLFAAFPLAYAVIMPALYAPIILMLLGLIFRGVAFEFRWRTVERHDWWDWSFALGSIVATFAQGVTLGALVQGIAVSDRAYAGGPWDWLTPFSLLTGLALLAGYALLGATWLIMKTRDELQQKARAFARKSAVMTLALIALVSLITPFLDTAYLSRWFSGATAIFSIIVPGLLAGAAWLLFRGLEGPRDWQAFVAALFIFVLCFIGILISFYPYMVPHALTIDEVAAPASSLEFLLVGTVVLVPMILIYTAFSYWVFRGKVDAHGGFH